MAGTMWTDNSHGGVPSGLYFLSNDQGYDTSAGTAYQYRSPEDYGADYGFFGRIADRWFGTNHAAESAASVYNASLSNRMNSEEAERNRQFEERMSNTALQRMMADANKAGINPYYLVNGSSSGSSSPAGSAASSSGSPSFGSSGNKKASNILGNLAATALTIAKIIAMFA